MTDQRGAKAYGTKAIFILTTNVGQRMIADLVREGKPIEEIAARMKEALSQIRHSKSDRPVFTPEFLARIKRVVVFKPLDAAAMHAIARKQVSDLARTWAETRGKELRVPPELTSTSGCGAGWTRSPVGRRGPGSRQAGRRVGRGPGPTGDVEPPGRISRGVRGGC